MRLRVEERIVGLFEGMRVEEGVLEVSLSVN
jgi:hypothetical protein